ncbi:hypothetical protein [Pseudonocardia xishanensis]|uniref:Uncharacterized protein n=1 Tax=Pseudonocardia xishanensis TaxID=630995 RepID=A0ABP8RQT9_9PSEU
MTTMSETGIEETATAAGSGRNATAAFAAKERAGGPVAPARV